MLRLCGRWWVGLRFISRSEGEGEMRRGLSEIIEFEPRHRKMGLGSLAVGSAAVGGSGFGGFGDWSAGYRQRTCEETEDRGADGGSAGS
jgi:hypothetical protein